MKQGYKLVEICVSQFQPGMLIRHKNWENTEFAFLLQKKDENSKYVIWICLEIYHLDYPEEETRTIHGKMSFAYTAKFRQVVREEESKDG